MMPFLLPVVFLGGGLVGFQMSEGANKLITLLALLVIGYVLFKGAK